MEPESEHDWTIHALNIHGAFFERWAAEVIARQPGWRVRATNYPVRIPLDPRPPGKESSIDIVATAVRTRVLVNLVIECKKNNPEFTNWIFFRKGTQQQLMLPGLSYGEYHFDEPPSWYIVRRPLVLDNVSVADEGREARGNYREHKRGDSKTRTANAAISEAAYQVALGAQALAWEEEDRAEAFDETERVHVLPERTWRDQTFVPVILTTANLKIASFMPDAVDPATGEIAYSDVTLSDAPYLIYDYALPRHLQAANRRIEHLVTEDDANVWSRLHIAVVNSRHISKFLGSEFIEKAFTREGAA
jgi:hypothetical protein